MMDTEKKSTNSHFVKLLDKLHKFGANIDAQDEDGNTPLHMCAKLGLSLFTRRLLELGANLKVENKSKRTALQLAEAEKVEETAEQMRKYLQRGKVTKPFEKDLKGIEGSLDEIPWFGAVGSCSEGR